MDRKTYNAAISRKYRMAHKKEINQRAIDLHQQEKIEVLSHYGLSGKLQCNWADCSITDVDMLSIDHTNNDGAEDRRNSIRGQGGIQTYHKLKLLGYPDGFQTLCYNHQWKKEMNRRREASRHGKYNARPKEF